MIRLAPARPRRALHRLSLGLALGTAMVASVQAAPATEGSGLAETSDAIETLIRALPQVQLATPQRGAPAAPARASAIELAAEPAGPANDSVLALLAERGLIQPLKRTGEVLRPLTRPVEFVQNAAHTVREHATGMVVSAMNFIGVPYRFGGNDAETGFDCSGFTRHVVEQALGVVLPRRADQQARAEGWQDVDPQALQPGDLVFFNTMRRAFSHVGIYVGDGKFIHAPRTGAQVRVENMRTSYWSQRFDGARRRE